MKACFIFLTPDKEGPVVDHEMNTLSITMRVCSATSYKNAIEIAKKVVNDGVEVIELCGGFGVHGVSMLKQALPDNILIGVVRFDNHPGLNFVSGDTLF